MIPRGISRSAGSFGSGSRSRAIPTLGWAHLATVTCCKGLPSKRISISASDCDSTWKGFPVSSGTTTRPAPPVQDDPADLQFAFMDVVPWLDEDQSLTVRFGRFGMSLGSGRLVATRAAPNIPFKFDGTELLYERTGWEALAFLTRPWQERADHDGFRIAKTMIRRFGAPISRTGSGHEAHSGTVSISITLAWPGRIPFTPPARPTNTAIHSVFARSAKWPGGIGMRRASCNLEVSATTRSSRGREASTRVIPGKTKSAWQPRAPA